MSAKLIFGSSATYLAVTIAERAVSLLLFPLMTRILTPGDYGVMLLIGNGASLINLLFGFSLALALPTLFSNASSEESRRAICTTILLSAGVILGVLYLAIALLSHDISTFFLQTPAYAGAIQLGALSAFMNACALCLVMLVRLTERHQLYLKVQLPALLIQIAILLSLFFSGSLNVKSQYVATAAAGTLAAAVYVITMRQWLSGRFDPQQLINAGRVGIQMLPWQVALLLATNSAAFFLTRAGHLDEAGFFLVASGAAGLVLAASTSFANVWTPFVLLRKDRPDLSNTQIRIFGLYSAALLVTASSLSIFSHELFMILAGPAFRQGYRFVPALAFAYSIFCFADCFAQGLQARERTIHYAWIGVLSSATFLVIALSLAGKLGAWGIIIAMTASFLVMLVLLQLVSARFMPVAYPWSRHGLMWLAAAAIVACAFPLEVSVTGAAIKFMALMCIVGLLFLFGAVRGSDLLLAKASLFPVPR